MHASLPPSLLLVNTWHVVHIGPQDPGQQRCCNGPLPKYADASHPPLWSCNRKRVLAPLSWGTRLYRVTALSLGGIHIQVGAPGIGTDCHCVLCGFEQWAGGGRTVCGFLWVSVKTSWSTHQAEASGGSVSRKQEWGHPSWSAGARPRNLCQQHCLRVVLSCQQ